MSLLDRLKQLFAEARAANTAEGAGAPAPAPARAPPAANDGGGNSASSGGPLLDRRRGGRTNAREGTRILVIDDSPTIVALIKRMLVQNEYTCLEAFDAESGLELAFNEQPDLIFLDIVLPGMDGFTALRTLRRDPRTRAIPVVMISGNEQATEQFYVQRIGADDFMKKPFSRAEVFSRIERLLDPERVPRRMADHAVKATPAP
jgi:twitching motility two-component system response regulator PilH